jgi:hypothetical protein
MSPTTGREFWRQPAGRARSGFRHQGECSPAFGAAEPRKTWTSALAREPMQFLCIEAWLTLEVALEGAGYKTRAQSETDAGSVFTLRVPKSKTHVGSPRESDSYRNEARHGWRKPVGLSWRRMGRAMTQIRSLTGSRSFLHFIRVGTPSPLLHPEVEMLRSLILAALHVLTSLHHHQQ